MSYNQRTRAIATTMEICIDAKVTGSYLPPERETPPSYACGGVPGSPEDVEDMDIVSLIGQRRVAGGWQDVDLLAGVDRKSPVFAKFIENLVDFIREEALEALLNEVAE